MLYLMLAAKLSSVRVTHVVLMLKAGKSGIELPRLDTVVGLRSLARGWGEGIGKIAASVAIESP